MKLLDKSVFDRITLMFEEHVSHQRRRDLARDPAWRAVFIIFDRLGTDQRVWRHVDTGEQTIDFAAILQDPTFSREERCLVEIAASLYNEEHKVNLFGALACLSEADTAAVVKAARTLNQMIAAS